MTTTTTTQETEEIQANPYNAKKSWDNSNPEASRGLQSADDSLAYVAPKKEVYVSKHEAIKEEKEVVTDTDAKQQATNEDDVFEEETTQQFKKVDYKKRYDDLKKHYDRKLGDWKAKEQSLRAEMLATRPKYKAPKTQDELATFREEYPDVYDVVETVAHLQAETQLSELQEKVNMLSEREAAASRRAAEQELLNLHPDFREIRQSEEFHEWAEVQPEAIQGWIYDNNGDATLAARAIDLYKQDIGISSKKVEKAVSKKSSPKEDPRGSAADAVSVKGKTETTESTEKIWTTSEIASLSVDQYEKYQEELDDAFRTGRIVNG